MTDPTTPETPLDRAHAAMAAAPDDSALRLRFHERLADAELFLLLAAEATGDAIDPRIFDTEDGRFLVAFDREERLADFAGGLAPYAALPGRTLAQMLAGQDLGLAVNPGAASETLVAPEALAWLATMLAAAPETAEARPSAFHPPAGLPESLISGLDGKFAAMAGMARAAWLVGVSYDGGEQGHLIAFVDALPGAEPALARAVAETLRFSGIDDGRLDVAFAAASDPLAARLARVGLRFDLPAPAAPAARPAPGSDPDKPPILR